MDETKLDYSDCSIQINKFYHIFIIPINIIRTLCTSNDKTYLFIMSFIRTIFWGIIVKLYYDNIDIRYPESNNWRILFIIIVMYFIINIIILFAIMFKKQKIKKEAKL